MRWRGLDRRPAPRSKQALERPCQDSPAEEWYSACSATGCDAGRVCVIGAVLCVAFTLSETTMDFIERRLGSALGNDTRSGS